MAKGTKKRYTIEEIEYLKKHYHNTPNKVLQLVIKHPVSSFSAIASSLGLKKDRDYSKQHFSYVSKKAWEGERERIKCFPKGHVPWNKGKKLSESHRAKLKSVFVKGNLPHNTKPIGTIRNNDGYNEIKLADNDWISVARNNWMQVHGEIPKGYVVFRMDGDKYNDEISNLCLVARKDLAVLNRNHSKLTPELKEVQILVNQIKEKTK